MAINIGAVTVMFSAIDAALVRPLPFSSPGQLVVLPSIPVPLDAGSGQPKSEFRYLDVTDAQTMPVYSAVASYASGGLNLIDETHSVRVQAGV